MEGDKHTKLKTALLKLPRNELMNLLEVTYKAMQNKHGIEPNTVNNTPYINHPPIKPNVESIKNLNIGNHNKNDKNIGNLNNRINVPVINPVNNAVNTNQINNNFIVDKGFDFKGKLVNNIPMGNLKIGNVHPLVQGRSVLKRNTHSHNQNLVQPLPAAAASFAPQRKL